MLRLLESDLAGYRLRDMLSRFRAEELTLVGALHDLQEQLERVQDLARCDRLDREPATACVPARLQRSQELQHEIDQVATELVHVRMAIAGTNDELLECDQRRFARGSRPGLVRSPA